ncbi:uncharacterized protein LOC127258870 [Andrographis paniculata]|uniref:uncharacterized protein LOC127258870 n=1 Tax=Andrographis paniculata TaxID=175694 RepID=UPI0021E93F90|nr:uncharacterized protein LOC127258870 [Andrographis paniculata]
MLSQQQKQLMVNLNHNMVMNQMALQSQQQMMVPANRGYSPWAAAAAPPPQFQKANSNPGAMKPPLPAFKKSLGPRSDWKGKNVKKANDKRRNEVQKSLISGDLNLVRGGCSGGLGNFNSYQPPNLTDLHHQNRVKSRKFFPKKKFNKNNNMNMMNVEANQNSYNNSMSAPLAPRNTTSFIIRAKRSGGIASLVSPSPMTPAVLPTPILSPSREVLVDMAKEEWGVDGYGSMKGLIRLRSPGHEDDAEDDGGSSESDVEEHVEVERRLDHDLSRFEMIYNPNEGVVDYHNVLENRVDDQDSHIAQLEDENLLLKGRLFLMERDLDELRRRIQFLERRRNEEDMNEEVVDNDYENGSENRGEETHSVEDNNEDFCEDSITRDDGSCKQKRDCTGAGCIISTTTSGFAGLLQKLRRPIYSDDVNMRYELMIHLWAGAGAGAVDHL